MLLPALKTARDMAKSTVCQNNLKQLFLIGYNYRDENGSWVKGFDNVTASWYFQRLFPNENLNVASNMWGPSLTGTRHPVGWQSLVCPASTDDWPSGWCAWYHVDYSANAVSVSNVPGSDGAPYPVRPEIIPWLVDGKRIWWDYATIVSNMQRLHHNGANVLYFDGHAMQQPWSNIPDELFNSRTKWK